MNELGKRVAYLKGLAEGLKVDAESQEGKLLLEIIETLEMFATSMQALTESHEELNDYVEDLDDSVSSMEDILFGDEDDEESDDEDEDGLIEYDCPHCDTTLFFDEETFSMEDDHKCPNCGKPIFSDDGEEDDE